MNSTRLSRLTGGVDRTATPANGVHHERQRLHHCLHRRPIAGRGVRRHKQCPRLVVRRDRRRDGLLEAEFPYRYKDVHRSTQTIRRWFPAVGSFGA